MDEEPDPGDHLLHYSSVNCSIPMKPLEAESKNKHHNELPVSLHALSGAFTVTTSMPLGALGEAKSLKNAPSLIPPLVPSCDSFNDTVKKLLVFDQSGDEMRCMFWSSNIRTPYCDCASHKLGLQEYGIEACGSGGDESQEMHENTEEIDALLYSDSSDDDPDEEEASTGHSPDETLACSISESASSILPVKRKRSIQDETCASLMDTASSLNPHVNQIVTKHSFEKVNSDAELSCVKVGEDNQNDGNNKLKRARIQETMSILRKIIPGGKSKDTVTLLEDAIGTLKSLQTKANLTAPSSQWQHWNLDILS